MHSFATYAKAVLEERSPVLESSSV